MRDPTDAALVWLWRSLLILAIGTLWFGAFSTLMPAKSIALYQTIMARFNWRVVPIDEARERRATQVLGALLVLLSLLAMWRLGPLLDLPGDDQGHSGFPISSG